MSESYVLCEGYHDRAFWRGLLMHAGCTDPGEVVNGARKAVYDDNNTIVQGKGTFGIRSRSQKFIRIVPALGKDFIVELLKTRLKERIGKPLSRLVVNVDNDKHADGSESLSATLKFEALYDAVREIDPRAVIGENREILIDDGSTAVVLIAWMAPDPHIAGLPLQHTLERVICAAIMATHSNRGGVVQTWLESRQQAPPAGPKEYAWSYLAGWHADTGSYEGFCSMVWKDREIAAQLQSRLERCGAWRVAQALAV